MTFTAHLLLTHMEKVANGMVYGIRVRLKDGQKIYKCYVTA